MQALYRLMTSHSLNLNLANMCHQIELLFLPDNLQALERKLVRLGIVQAQAVYKLL